MSNIMNKSNKRNIIRNLHASEPLVAAGRAGNLPRVIAAVLPTAGVWSGSALSPFAVIHSFNAAVNGAAPESGLACGTNGYFMEQLWATGCALTALFQPYAFPLPQTIYTFWRLD